MLSLFFATNHVCFYNSYTFVTSLCTKYVQLVLFYNHLTY